MASHCPQCGTPCDAEERFCTACGNPLSEQAETSHKDQPTPPDANADIGAARTVYGVAPVSAPDETHAKRAKPPMARITPAPTPTAAAAEKGTMLGLPHAGTTPLADAGHGASHGNGKAAALPGDRKATSEPALETDAPVVRRSPKPSDPAAEPGHADTAQAATHQRRQNEPGATGTTRTILAIAGIGILAGVTLLFYLLFEDQATLTPQVFRTSDGEEITIVFPFPHAPPGSTIQLAGQTAPIANGQAQIRLKTADLKLGTNHFVSTYTEPGAEPQAENVPIVLRHSIRNDMGGLETQDAFVTVHFHVAPGIELAVEGTPIDTAGGRYRHRLSVAEIARSADKSGDTLIYKLAYRISDRDGNTEQGLHPVVVPLTRLQIDRPGIKAIVDTATVVCAGITEKGAEITVNGKSVGVSATGFHTTVPIPNMGEHQIDITAHAPGKAPQSETVSVMRIENLSHAIDDWASDLNPRLDYPTLGRNPDAHVNKKIKLTGRIVNINTEKGVTAFLLYVAKGCPVGARCAVYAVFRGETDAGLQSWVNLFGHVKGSRAIDLPNGQKIEVPAVDAKFVVKRNRKRRR